MSRPICEAIGWNLAMALKEKGWTHRKLSEEVGTSKTRVDGWICREFGGNINYLVKVHEALGLPLWSLVPTADEVEELGLYE